jgi:hypothetical protein
MTITTDGIVLSEQRYIVLAIKFPAKHVISYYHLMQNFFISHLLS